MGSPSWKLSGRHEACYWGWTGANTMITESAITAAQLKSLGKESITIHLTCLMLLPLPLLMIVGKVIISMKPLHDCRTKSPEFIAQRSFSCSLQKVSQGLRLGLGFACLPQRGHRQRWLCSKLYSKLVAKLAPSPWSNSGLPCESLHDNVKKGWITHFNSSSTDCKMLRLCNHACLKKWQQLCVWSHSSLLETCTQEVRRETSSHNF